ncbi:MAG: GNAT family N-acetyltransferase [Burkholderiaceae bacterium]
MRLVDSLSLVPAADWNTLAGDGPGAVFVRHEWLSALETSGSVGADTGWQPLHLLLEDMDKKLVGAVPMYAKYHSYGEYVFDWAWADAYRRNGLDYYPKLLSAVPFTPIAGNRLMARDNTARAALAEGLRIQAQRAKVSSLHILFPDDDGKKALSDAGYMIRTGVQFHWRNQGFKDFDEFLAALSQKKRKKIRAERRKVAEAGVTCTRLVADEITEADWQFFIRCYNQTYREHHSTPYLNLKFFQTVAKLKPEAFIMIRAEQDGKPIGASLLVRDGDRIFGRYWGALEWVSHMHFEVAYYQTIEAAIALGIQVIEGGAQGEHKMARGFLPVATCSAHWLAEPAFADAVQDFLERETTMMDGYIGELEERSVFAGAKPQP